MFSASRPLDRVRATRPGVYLLRFLLLGLLLPSLLVRGGDDVHLYLKGRWLLEGVGPKQHRHIVRFAATKNSLSGTYTDHRGIQKPLRALSFDGETLRFNVVGFDFSLLLTRQDDHFVGELWDRPADERHAVTMRTKETRRGRLERHVAAEPAQPAQPRLAQPVAVEAGQPVAARQPVAAAAMTQPAVPPSAAAPAETRYVADKAFVLKGDWLMESADGKRRRWYLTFSGGIGDPRGSWITPQGFERHLVGVLYDGERLQFTIRESGLTALLTRDGETFAGFVEIDGRRQTVSAKQR